jgi:hypothetical protein
MTFACPKGHQSTDPEYCSECGTALGAVTAVRSAEAAVPPASAFTAATGEGPEGEKCPCCQTLREGKLQYCEVCRYDFIHRQAYEPGVPARQPVGKSEAASSAMSAGVSGMSGASGSSGASTMPDASGMSNASNASNANAADADGSATTVPAPAEYQRLMVVIHVDASLDTFQDPRNRPPAAQPERIFHLDLEENVVGRTSESRHIHPEVVVGDTSVSRRHLKFIRNPDGSYSALELGSSNGTLLNGAPLAAGERTPIKSGDEFIIGAWTRLSIRHR